MREELRRQIAELEAEISRFMALECPDVELPALLCRGPALLSSEELEQVRDELLELRADLHDYVIAQVRARWNEPAPRRRWWDRLRGR
jgi:hypothetical protein